MFESRLAKQNVPKRRVARSATDSRKGVLDAGGAAGRLLTVLECSAARHRLARVPKAASRLQAKLVSGPEGSRI